MKIRKKILFKQVDCIKNLQGGFAPSEEGTGSVAQLVLFINSKALCTFPVIKS